MLKKCALKVHALLGACGCCAPYYSSEFHFQVIEVNIFLIISSLKLQIALKGYGNYSVFG